MKQTPGSSNLASTAARIIEMPQNVPIHSESMSELEHFIPNVGYLQDSDLHASSSMAPPTVQGFGSNCAGDQMVDPFRRFVCPQCNKAFKMRHHLAEHVVVHNDEKPYKCPVCPARFKRSKQTKRHVRTRHSDLDADNMIYPATPMEEDLF